MTNPDQKPLSLKERIAQEATKLEAEKRAGVERKRDEFQEKRERLKHMVEALAGVLRLNQATSEDAQEMFRLVKEYLGERLKTKIELWRGKDEKGREIRYALGIGEKLGPFARAYFYGDGNPENRVFIQGHERDPKSRQDKDDRGDWLKGPDDSAVLLREYLVPEEMISDAGLELAGSYRNDIANHNQGGFWGVDGEFTIDENNKYLYSEYEKNVFGPEGDDYFRGTHKYGRQQHEHESIIQIKGNPLEELLVKAAEELEKSGAKPSEISQKVEEVITPIIEKLAREELERAQK